MLIAGEMHTTSRLPGRPARRTTTAHYLPCLNYKCSPYFYANFIADPGTTNRLLCEFTAHKYKYSEWEFYSIIIE